MACHIKRTGDHHIKIKTLPKEIRVDIFKKLPQNDALNLRLVCKEWNEEIKEHFEFHIKFDESSPYCHQILGLRIAHLEIYRLTDYEYRIGNSTPDRSRQRPELIFQHPNQVRQLSIKQFSDPKHPKPDKNVKILPENAGQLLNFFSKSLKSLHFGFSLEMMLHKVEPQTFYEFPNLETLRIDVTFDISVNVDKFEPPRTDSILAQLERSQFPNLTSLEVGGYTTAVSRSIETIVKFINKNPRGLKRLGIFLSGFHLDTCKLDVEEEELRTLTSVTKLEVMEFKFGITSVNDNIDEIVALLSNVIRNQRKLRIVNLCNLNASGTSFLVNPALLHWLTLTNFETLETLNLDAVNPAEGGQIDLSVFKTCHKLSSLTLGMYEEFAFGMTPPRSKLSAVVNFKDLPPNLTNFSLQRFNILTVDLLALLDLETVQGLETLELRNCGSSDDFGINFQVIEKIGSLKMIEYFKPEVSLEGFNTSDLQRFTKDFRSVWGRFQRRHLKAFSIKFVGWDKEPTYVLTETP